MAFRTSSLFSTTTATTAMRRSFPSSMGGMRLASTRGPFTNTGGASFASGSGGHSGESNGNVRTFTGYNIYKGKAAINIKPIPPTFRVNRSNRVLDREGVLLWEFAPANGQREYNWNAKVTFAMDVNECGELLAMDRSRTIEFLHDPGMGGNDAGKVTKKIRIQPTQDGKGVFVSLSFTDKTQNINTSHSVPITWAELEVIRTTAQYCLPRFLGLDKVFEDIVEAPSSSHGSSGGFQGFDASHGHAGGAPSPTWN